MTSYVAQVGLALKILLPQSPECWNLRPVPYSMPGHTHSLASCSSLSDVLHPGVLRHWPICPMGPPKHHVLARPLSYVLLSVLLHVVTTFPSLFPSQTLGSHLPLLFPSPNVTSCGQCVRALLLACPISLATLYSFPDLSTSCKSIHLTSSVHPFFRLSPPTSGLESDSSYGGSCGHIVNICSSIHPFLPLPASWTSKPSF